MKHKKYWITGLLAIAIFSLLFLVNGIFPFGNHSIIWSDMHEQITAMYYHFYDAIRGNQSLFVDFTSGGGLNFWGVLSYYIMSPFSFILLLFPRSLVENAVSIIVVLKTLLASLTCLYFISKYFKKIKPSYQILLSLLYAFSSYTFALYIITPWMDIVYLFPLLMIGLHKLLDLEGSKTYIIVLTLCLIFCFYLSFMVLLFIIFVSLIYLLVYQKENRKQAIFHLGVATVISLLLSAFVLVPSFLQIATSQRAGFNFSVIANSKFGPLSDKIAFLFGSGIFLAMILLLLWDWKKHKKFLSFLCPLLLLLGIPIFIEPINKMWHFGSYVCFPYRYGFILIFLLMVGSCYYFSSVESKERKTNSFTKLLPILSIVLSLLLMVFVFIQYGSSIREAIDSLTFTRDKKDIILLFLVFFAIFISSILVLLFRKKMSTFSIVSLYILAISHIFFQGSLYMNRCDDALLSKQYDQMLRLNRVKGVTNHYYVKEVSRDLISNYGMVSGINTYSNFTSLTDHTNFMTMQRLGYDSYWMDTESIGGNLFTDIILAQKYIISNEEYHDEYYSYINQEEDLNYYRFKDNMSYGYLIRENISLEDVANSFEASNRIYHAITGKNSIFSITDLFHSNDNSPTSYEKDLELEKTFSVEGKGRLYLEIFTDFDSAFKTNHYNVFDVYVNGKLAFSEVPNIDRNGTLDLGTFTDEEVTVKIVSLKKAMIRNITVGQLDLDLFDDFVKNYAIDPKVEFDRNSISIEVEGKEGDLLFLPITYLDGYLTNQYDIVRVFDNFVGIRLQEGINHISIHYIPKGFLIGILLTLVGILLYFVWTKYLYTVNLSMFYNFIYYIYLVIYACLVIVFYVVMFLLFIKSFLF